MAEEKAVSLSSIAEFHKIPPHEFEKQYKEHLSEFKVWDQKDHADDWLLFGNNIGTHLSLDETSISNGELYTILTNKAKKGGKGTLVATVEGTATKDIARVFSMIPLEKRLLVQEVTLDFSASMEAAARSVFPHARITTDRFHVTQIVTEALQQIRITLRLDAMKEENALVKEARAAHTSYVPMTYANEETKKQLLARSRYLLFKPSNKWTPKQQTRSVILFTEFPDLEDGYKLSMQFRNFYETSTTKEEGEQRFNAWMKKVEEKKFDTFITAAEYLKNHLETVLNYFPGRSTNASAESFNAKLKGFRALLRGVRDTSFFLFRVSKLYA